MNKLVSQLLLALSLFSQFALAAQSCELPSKSPSAAFANGERCHDPDLGNANVCLAHCLQDSQTLDSQQPVFAAAPANYVVVAFHFVERSRIAPHAPVRTSDPPASIRFCSFQI